MTFEENQNTLLASDLDGVKQAFELEMDRRAIFIGLRPPHPHLQIVDFINGRLASLYA